MKSLALALMLLFTTLSYAQNQPRARDLGIPFDGMPGPLNAITDVAGVEVGFSLEKGSSSPAKARYAPESPLFSPAVSRASTNQCSQDGIRSTVMAR
ncbi:MAG TPA: hypothetical protein VFB24_01980 [Candidatus Binatia bacterium]|nr:hypothetical protein [Candidatus Binatia bacterium]